MCKRDTPGPPPHHGHDPAGPKGADGQFQGTSPGVCAIEGEVTKAQERNAASGKRCGDTELRADVKRQDDGRPPRQFLSLIHISEPTRQY